MYDTMTNFNHALSVPESQCDDGNLLSFISWSDGGARERIVNTGTGDSALVANYAVTGTCIPIANVPDDGDSIGRTLGSVVSEGLVARFEADELVSVDDNNVVISWDDLSGSGNKLDAIGDPTLNMDALDGRPTISFDGDGDALQRLGALINLPIGSEDRTMYLVAQYNSVGFGGAVYGTATNNEAFGLVVSNVGNLTVQGWSAANDFESEELGTGQGFLTQAVVYENGTLTHKLNGEVIDTEEHTFDTDSGRLVLGSGIDSALFMRMEISALFIYNRALSSEEQGSLETYLETKYFRESGTPLAINDTGLVTHEGTVQLDVLANDIDVQGLDVTSTSIVKPASNGAATVNPDGTISYTHNGSFVVEDRFTYSVGMANGGLSNEAVVVVIVAGNEVLPGGLVALADASSAPDRIVSPVETSSDIAVAARLVSSESSVLNTADFAASFDEKSNSPAGQSDSMGTLRAKPDQGLMGQGGTIVLDILRNDKSVSGLIPNSVVAAQLPRYGSIDINSDGSVTYVHNGGAATRTRFRITWQMAMVTELIQRLSTSQ